MDDNNNFNQSKRVQASRLAADEDLQRDLTNVLGRLDRYDYTYQSTWLGLPIIQCPSDIIAQQEIIWACRPTVIIETGVARGGSMAFLASMLKLVDGRAVIGVDVDIRSHNRARIEAHPLASMICLIEGSSTDIHTIESVRSCLMPHDRVMVILDSNHSHEHVAAELEIFSPLVTSGQYLVVANTIVDFIPVQSHRPRPWGPKDSPYSALVQFLESYPEFSLDVEIDNKLALSCNPKGYLRRESAQ